MVTQQIRDRVLVNQPTCPSRKREIQYLFSLVGRWGRLENGPVVLGDRIFLWSYPGSLAETKECLLCPPPTLSQPQSWGWGWGREQSSGRREGEARMGEGRKGGKGLGDRGSQRMSKQTMS